jgi:hypothetical protein
VPRPADIDVRKPQVSSSNLEVGSRNNAEFVIQPSKRDSPSDSPSQECKDADTCGVVRTDPVEVALAEALQRAAEAGQWKTVVRLAAELEARRTERHLAGAIDDAGSVESAPLPTTKPKKY